jgi:hypothetical protein
MDLILMANAPRHIHLVLIQKIHCYINSQIMSNHNNFLPKVIAA